MIYDIVHPLVWDAVILAFVIGWTMCFQLVVPGLLKSYLDGLRTWISNLRNITPNRVDMLLYAGLLIILASIWLGDYTMAGKSLWSGVWLIVVALYMALPEWFGNDATPQ